MKKPTLEEHIENANDFAIIMHHMNRIRNRMKRVFTKSHPVRKALEKMAISNLNRTWVKLSSDLDSLYHREITDEQFDVYGHIYYNLHERYKHLSEELPPLLKSGAVNQCQGAVNHVRANNQ